jgi:hypothetical protein
MNEMSKTCKIENNSNMNSKQNSKQEMKTEIKGKEKRTLPGRVAHQAAQHRQPSTAHRGPCTSSRG